MKNLIFPRERNIVECFDLAIILCRRFWKSLILFSLPGLLIILAVHMWMTHGGLDDDVSGIILYTAMVMLLHPLLSAPVAWYLGQAIFSRPVSLRLFLAAVRRGFGTLFMYGLVARAFFMLIGITFLFYPNYVLEVAMLEQQGLKASHKRINSLAKVSHRSPAPWYMLFALVAVGSIIAGAWCMSEVWDMLRYQVGFQNSFVGLLTPAETLVPTLLYWPVGIYLTVVRFIGYIDLRTRMEGWAVEQQFRSLAEELLHVAR